MQGSQLILRHNSCRACDGPGYTWLVRLLHLVVLGHPITSYD